MTIALAADIEKAFLMISVWPPDRDALRFLWVDDVNTPSPQITVYRFTRVVFGVSCSPFLLDATLKRHIESFADKQSEVCQRLVNSFYADDVNTGGYDEEEAIELYKVAKEIMTQGGFNLRKWVSNSKQVTAQISVNESQQDRLVPNDLKTTEDDQSFAKTSLKQCETMESEENKVLGLTWETETDSLVFNLKTLAANALEAEMTKWTVLGVIAKIYDPLGLITPITSPLKVYLQRLFRENIAWDELLSEELS